MKKHPLHLKNPGSQTPLEVNRVVKRKKDREDEKNKPTKQEKAFAFQKFKKLEKYIRLSLFGSLQQYKGKKASVIEKVGQTATGEHAFKKLFLAPKIISYFRNSNIEVLIEGVASEGKTKLNKTFLGSQPIADFSFRQKTQATLLPWTHNVLVPLATIGEIKYGDLTFRSFVTGLGQIIGYLQASKFENGQKWYGYYIFFNTNLEKSLSKDEIAFFNNLWKEENIFVVVM